MKTYIYNLTHRKVCSNCGMKNPTLLHTKIQYTKCCMKQNKLSSHGLLIEQTFKFPFKWIGFWN